MRAFSILPGIDFFDRVELSEGNSDWDFKKWKMGAPLPFNRPLSAGIHAIINPINRELLSNTA